MSIQCQVGIFSLRGAMLMGAYPKHLLLPDIEREPTSPRVHCMNQPLLIADAGLHPDTAAVTRQTATAAITALAAVLSTVSLTAAAAAVCVPAVPVVISPVDVLTSCASTATVGCVLLGAAVNVCMCAAACWGGV